MDKGTSDTPQYPWKAEGPALEIKRVHAPSLAPQPPPFFKSERGSDCCAKCRDIIHTFKVWRFLPDGDIVPSGRAGTFQRQHYNVSSLRISASRGCPICRFFYHEIGLQLIAQNSRIFTETKMKFAITTSQPSSIEIIDFSYRSRIFEVYRRDGSTLRNDTIREFIALGTASEHISKYFVLCDVQPHPLYSTCWAIVQNWIATCAEHHSHCSPPNSNSLPTRIIDVSESRPRLVDGTTKGGRYTALSHCWGQGHHPLSHTTSLTMRDFCNGIDLTDLPATYRDAIEVTRRLKIQYIWIDSLCIIQDSIEDWQKEAKKMGSYYENCFLNISALDSPESDTGFLMQRQTRRTWRRVFQESPLSRRAWVLQERLVSTRVLHYGRDDMFWECLTCSTRESDPTVYRLTNQDTEWLDENFKRSLQFSQTEVSVVLHKWYKVVAQYTRLSMSHESDMLPAISAIAERIRQVTDFSYCAGIWQEDLLQGLLWYADGPRSAPKIWRAPSWSWAQLTGPIEHLFSPKCERIESRFDLKILEYCNDIKTRNEGRETIHRDALSVVGYKINVWSKSSHGDPPYNNPGLKLIVDIYDEKGMPLGTGYLDAFIGEEPIRYCTALAVSARQNLAPKNGPKLVFLLVEPVDENAQVYRRIGLGQSFDPFQGTFYEFQDAFGQEPPVSLILI
ncbi:HET-domain-containing protein, partial [Stipitochalara longipes BDJ]